MAGVNFRPIPTFADDDLAECFEAIPQGVLDSRQRWIFRAHSAQGMPRSINRDHLTAWTRCAAASDDETFAGVLTYLLAAEPTAAQGELIAQCRILPAATEEFIIERALLQDDSTAAQFLGRVDQDIKDDCAEIISEGGTEPTRAAVDACRAVANTLSNSVASTPNLKHAAFVEEEGGISLVLQSNTTNRRVNFRVSPSGATLVVVTVDAIGRTASTPTRLDDSKALRGWVEWLSQAR
jgi:hypothetical protein